MPIHCQPPCKRVMYQGISSARLPDQMMSNCENEKYAHNMVKVSSSLPISWKCEGPMTPLRGPPSSDRITSRAMQNDSAESPCPAMISNPKIVENQCGSSDITQSTAANVTLRP